MTDNENKVREMSESETDAYTGQTIDANTGAEEPPRNQQQQYQEQAPFGSNNGSSPFRLFTTQDLSLKGIAKYLWQNTTWKTKGIVLLAVTALILSLGFLLAVALPIILTVVGAVVIASWVFTYFMKH